MSHTPGEGRYLSAEEIASLDMEAIRRFFGFEPAVVITDDDIVEVL